MNVQLSQELESMVQRRVESGRYSSATEVLRDALRLLADREEALHARRQEIERKIAEGLEELDRGDSVDGHEFFEQLAREEALLEAGSRPA